jgi:hypothetical protein
MRTPSAVGTPVIPDREREHRWSEREPEASVACSIRDNDRKLGRLIAVGAALGYPVGYDQGAAVQFTRRS